MKRVVNSVKNNFQNVYTSLNEFVDFSKNNVVSIIIITISVIFAYGMKLFNLVHSIDTEKIMHSFDSIISDWLMVGRYGSVFTKKIFGLDQFNMYTEVFLMMITMVLLSMVWAFLFSKCAGEHKNKSIVNCVFPMLFITAPLFADQFTFMLQSFEVAFSILLVGISIYTLNTWIKDSKQYISLFISIITLTWALASYQSNIFLFICSVIACIVISYYKENGQKIYKEKYFLAAIKSIAMLAFSLVLYKGIHKLIQMKYGSFIYTENMVKWNKRPIAESVKSILSYIKMTIVGDGIFYSKVFFFVAIVVVIIAAVNLFSKRKGKFIISLSLIFFLGTPYILSFILGDFLVPRMQFAYQFVVAFSIYFFVIIAPMKKIKMVPIILAFMITLSNCSTVSNLFLTDYNKFKAESELAYEINLRVNAINKDKDKIVFTGNYYPEHKSFYNMAVTRGAIIDSSIFLWDNFRMVGFLNSLGFSYEMASPQEIEEATKFAEDKPVWPAEDSIIECENYIIINLS